jgi:hypothetical protein
MTAHAAAGNQPINVIWRIRHIMPENILPRSKKESHGNKIASSVIQIRIIIFLVPGTFIKVTTGKCSGGGDFV